MNATRLLGIVLLVGGVLAVIYGGFSYTKDTTVAKVGPIELSAKKQENVNIPLWAGVAAAVVGGFLLVGGGRKG